MKKILFTLFLALVAVPALACTSVIISGKVRADGRPVMMKHRDTSHKTNDIRWFQGEKYAFIGLVNTDVPLDKEIWAGTNSAGFSIMNTATIDTLSKPMGVEANFGVIDAQGGAVYYEMDNWKIRAKYDVNEEPTGYRVVTNFTWQGREADRKGVDRYEKACSLLAETCIPISEWDHDFLINKISRSGAPILRTITTASVVFEGGIMWASLGQPDKNPYNAYQLSNFPK